MPRTSISIQFVGILLIILQLIPVLPWCDGSLNKELRLWKVALSFCSPIRIIFQHILLHAFPCRTTTRQLLRDVFPTCHFSVVPAEIRDSNIILYASKIVSSGLHSRWVHPKYTTFLQWTYTFDSCNFWQRLWHSSDGIATLHVHSDVPVFLAWQRTENLQECRFFFEFYLRVLERVSNTYRIHSNLSLLWNAWRKLDTELFWLFRWVRTVQLNVCPSLLACALIPRWTHWIRLLVSSLWWWTCRDIRLAVYQQNFAARSSAPRLCRCRLVILHELRRSTWDGPSSVSALFRLGASACVLPAVSRGSFWTLLWTPFGPCLTGDFPRLHWLKTSYCCCCCCCSFHALFDNNTWSRSWCWRPLVNRHFTAWWDHSFNTVKWHCAVCDGCMRFRLPKNSMPFSCALPKVNPINSVLRVLPSCFVLNFCGFRKSRQYFLLLLRYTMDPMVWTTFSSSCDEPSIQCGCEIERTSSMEHELLPIVRYGDVAQHLWWNHFLLCVLEWLEGTAISCKNSDNTGILFCCFLSRWSWSNLCQWNSFLHHVGIWLWASDW